jgi:hypothetical protein
LKARGKSEIQLDGKEGLWVIAQLKGEKVRWGREVLFSYN